jgi:sec-independent protein translocase protein TatB
MFDIGFSELLVIAVVALLVLGPERLPKAARFAGLWVRRARAQWQSVKTEFENELADSELKRSLRDTQEALRQAHASLREAGTGLEKDLHDTRDALMQGPAPAAGVPPLVAADAVGADRSMDAVPAEDRPTAEDMDDDADVLESSLLPLDEPTLPTDDDDTIDGDDHAHADGHDSHHVPQR